MIPTLGRPGTLPRSAWVLLALIVLTVTADFMVIPYYAVHFTQTLGLSIIFAATAMTTYTLTSKCAQFVGGYLTDRFNPELLITAGFAAMVLAFLTLAAAQAALPAIAAMLVLGLGDGCLVVAMRYKLVAGADPSLRPRLFALMSMCFNTGAIVGPLVGVLLLGLSPKLTFTTIAIVYAAAYLMQRLLTSPAEPPATRQSDLPTDLRGLAKDRELVLMVVLITGFWVSFSQFQFSLPVTVAALHPANGRGAIGTLFALNGVLVVLLSLPMTRALEQRLARNVMLVGLALVQLSYLLLAALQQAGTPFAYTYGVVVVFTLGEILFNTFANTHMTTIAPNGRLATYLGLLGLATGIGAAIGNALSGAVVGPLLAADSPGLAWIAIVTVSMVFPAVAIRLPRRACQGKSTRATGPDDLAEEQIAATDTTGTGHHRAP